MKTLQCCVHTKCSRWRHARMVSVASSYFSFRIRHSTPNGPMNCGRLSYSMNSSRYPKLWRESKLRAKNKPTNNKRVFARSVLQLFLTSHSIGDERKLRVMVQRLYVRSCCSYFYIVFHLLTQLFKLQHAEKYLRLSLQFCSFFLFSSLKKTHQEQQRSIAQIDIS